MDEDSPAELGGLGGDTGRRKHSGATELRVLVEYWSLEVCAENCKSPAYDVKPGAVTRLLRKYAIRKKREAQNRGLGSPQMERER